MKPNIKANLIQSWTSEQLVEMIRKEGHIANQRISSLKKSGYYDLNQVIQLKWNSFLKSTEYGTSSGFFSLKTKGKTRQQLMTQYTNIRNFLAGSTRIQDTKEQLRRQADRLGTGVGNVSRIYRLYIQLGLPRDFQDSDLVFNIISERVHKGQTDDEILNAGRRAMDSATTAGEFLREFSENAKYF